MRLTLRTLLAYMEGILEPEQAEVLRKKIEESEVARNLMERIREVTRRLRLGAPPVMGHKGPLLDPNTVAEYLDNTLHGDRVPDFEKVCLESDMALAEVASCHQILAMILGEPAEIDPVTRQKMYQLPEQAAAKAKEEAETLQPSGVGGGGEVKPEKAPEQDTPPPAPSSAVPDYLREAPKGRWFWAAAVLLFLAGFLTMIVLGSLGLIGPRGPLGWLWSTAEEGTSVEPTGEPSFPAQPSQPSPGQPSEKLSQPKEVMPPANQKAGTASPEHLPEAPLPEDLQKTPPAAPSEQTTPPPSEKPEEKPKAEPPPETEPKSLETKPEEKAMPAQPETAKPASEAPQILGQLVSDREVLLGLDPVQRDWWRIKPPGNVSSGQKLFALPTFRPAIGLAPGVTVTLVGPVEVELLPGSAVQPPGMKILFGKLRISRVGQEPTPFRIQVETVTGMLSFLDPDATIAIAVSRKHLPGNDPTLAPDPVKVEVYVTQGRATLAMEESPAMELAGPILLPIEMVCTRTEPVRAWKIALRQAGALEKVPEWITTDTSSPLERQAAAEVEQKLQPDRLARIGLMELLEHRRSEVQTFASRCLGYLGEYQQLVALLNKPAERAAWFESLELLQEAVGWGSESANAVREALEKQYGPQNGPLLYRMLLGYSEAQLVEGEAATLVDRLEHPDLVFRVMSWWNLQKLTGKTFYYQPNDSKNKQDPAVKRWRDWLAQFTAGKISLGKEPAGPKEAAKPFGPAEPAPQPTPPESSPPAPPAQPPEIPLERKILPEPAPPMPEAPPAEKAL